MSLTPSDPLLISASAGSFPSILSAATVGPNGSSATFTFGNITNTATDPTSPETITAVYRVVALNVSANTNNRTQSNSAKFTYTGGSAQGQAPATIVVPQMQVAKTIDKPTAAAGDLVTYTLTINHTAASGADAFNVALSDVVPAGVTYVPGSFVYVSGLAPTSHKRGRIDAECRLRQLSPGATSVLSFQAIVDDNIAAFQTVTNTASIQYTTLPGSISTPISPFNPNSVERTGNPVDPGGAANNLNALSIRVVDPHTDARQDHHGHRPVIYHRKPGGHRRASPLPGDVHGPPGRLAGLDPDRYASCRSGSRECGFHHGDSEREHLGARWLRRREGRGPGGPRRIDRASRFRHPDQFRPRRFDPVGHH